MTVAGNTNRSAYRREDNEIRGRHLVANRVIEEGEIVFHERPLLSLQTIGNAHDGALVCRRCRCFLSCRETQLKICAGQMSRSDVKGNEENIVSCRAKCGEYFCSKKCEESAWECYGHMFLCTGDIPESSSEQEHHPLIKFKMHAIQTNEIFLMVADWIARVICLRARDLKLGKVSDLNDVLIPFCDFTMTPWWDVITAMEELQAATFNQQISNESIADDNCSCEGSSSELDDNLPLSETLKNLCDDSVLLLREVFTAFFDKYDDQSSPDLRLYFRGFQECIKNGIFTRDMFAKVIGSFEQNAIGIRARHPLCTDILFGGMDKNGDVYDSGEYLRYKYGPLILNCLENSERDDKADSKIDTQFQSSQLRDEIHKRLAQMHIDISDEFGNSVEQLDDLDQCFAPMDGTAMFSLACKMNHSCSPNVLVRYRCGWGQSRPLVLQCVAIRRISIDEELCISYIQCDAPLSERQEALENYGFRCTCQKCIFDESSNPKIRNDMGSNEELVESLFGNDSDSDNEEMSLLLKQHHSCDDIIKQIVKSNFDHSPKFGAIPISNLASGLQFLLKEGSLICKKFEHYENDGTSSDDMRVLQRIMKHCIVSAQIRHLRSCGIHGRYGIKESFSILKKNGSWPNSTCTEAYGCFAVAASIGYANEGYFCDASNALDKAIILSPLCREDIPDFFDYVLKHCEGIFDNERCLAFSVAQKISLYESIDKSLSKPLVTNAEEILSEGITPESFSSYIDEAKPLVLRSLASQWEALLKWRDLNSFVMKYGHRIVPIEIGSMSGGNLRETLMTLSDFVVNYLYPSYLHTWPLTRSIDQSKSVAYMAQFRIFDLIPELMTDIESNLILLGGVPVQIHGWFGTGGTRTPLHYDSYDNILVQVVGFKYIRLYRSDQTKYLYQVSTKNAQGSLLSQGNFSAVDCEQEDHKKHPKVSKAKYVELVLSPGDAVYIPAGCWHYVRSLTTSFSVNYFWTPT